MIILDGHSLTPEELMRVKYGNGEQVRLSSLAWQRVRNSRRHIEAAILKGLPVYGVNTGFGAFQNVRLPADKLDELQVNLIRSHAAGVGQPLSNDRVKRLMVVRLNVLSKGFSGIREQTLRRMIECVNRDCLPLVPERYVCLL
jgi:histidine ammonia-lyase